MEQAENDQRRDAYPEPDPLLPLPDDILDDVLRRLSPRELSVLRCVGKPWRAAVDTRGLLLPRSVGGLFIWFNNLDSLEYLARPTSTGTPVISGKLDFMPTLPYEPGPPSALLMDHCNGLLLFHHCVVNPATKRCAPLPPRPPELSWRNKHFYYNDEYFYHDEYLVFDPAVSPHHEVFVIPKILYRDGQEYVHYQSSELANPKIENSEWPPSSWNLSVFSSRTGRWEERSFVREGPGGGSGTVACKRWSSVSHGEGHYTAYWQGQLYVHHDANFFIRIFLSENKYQVIKPPMRIRGSESQFHLGRSEKGVYCALAYCSNDSYWLRVWILEESSCGDMKWVLKNQTDLESLLARRKFDEQFGRPWILQDINYSENPDTDDDTDEEAPLEGSQWGWDSDDDNVLQIGDRDEDYYRSYTVLGFHPYKEVVFLNESRRRGLAVHLNSSKVQDLGNIHPRNYGYIAGHHAHINMSFPYTPCWIGEYPVRQS